jgi:hypothetical protein
MDRAANQPKMDASRTPVGPEGLPNQCPTPKRNAVSHSACVMPRAGISRASSTCRKRNSSENVLMAAPATISGINGSSRPVDPKSGWRAATTFATTGPTLRSRAMGSSQPQDTEIRRPMRTNRARRSPTARNRSARESPLPIKLRAKVVTGISFAELTRTKLTPGVRLRFHETQTLDCSTTDSNLDSHARPPAPRPDPGNRPPLVFGRAPTWLFRGPGRSCGRLSRGLARAPVAERNAMSGRLLRMTRPLSQAITTVAALAGAGRLANVVSVALMGPTVAEESHRHNERLAGPSAQAARQPPGAADHGRGARAPQPPCRSSDVEGVFTPRRNRTAVPALKGPCPSR